MYWLSRHDPVRREEIASSCESVAKYFLFLVASQSRHLVTLCIQFLVLQLYNGSIFDQLLSLSRESAGKEIFMGGSSKITSARERRTFSWSRLNWQCEQVHDCDACTYAMRTSCDDSLATPVARKIQSRLQCVPGIILNGNNDRHGSSGMSSHFVEVFAHPFYQHVLHRQLARNCIPARSEC